LVVGLGRPLLVDGAVSERVKAFPFARSFTSTNRVEASPDWNPASPLVFPNQRRKISRPNSELRILVVRLTGVCVVLSAGDACPQLNVQKALKLADAVRHPPQIRSKIPGFLIIIPPASVASRFTSSVVNMKVSST
jgi:hypothetical protein